MKINLNMFNSGMLNRIETEMSGSKIVMVSDVAFARARYSASVEDQATARCFLELHEIRLDPRKLM
jgi:hypothetical protein